MKVTDAIAKWLVAQGVKHVFGVNGGANLHLIHSIYDAQIHFIPGTHECNSGFAADSYSRITGLGIATGTSGPGATNLVTAIATSYYDSVPVLYLTGQVASFRFGARFGVRQYGFQETPIVDMVKGITKYAAEPMTAKAVLPTLETALMHMQMGRKGPALVSLCDDIQRAEL